MTSTTILAGAVATGNPPAAIAPGDWNINGLQFDAWLRLNHNTSLTITQHPVEYGAAITDHAYVNPKRFSFDIGMTDVFSQPAFNGIGPRSVSAYQFLVKLQETRQPLTMTTKYGNYSSVLIESIDVADDWQSQNAMKATINLLEVIQVNSKVSPVSTNPHATDTTNRGKVSAIPRLGTLQRAIFDASPLPAVKGFLERFKP